MITKIQKWGNSQGLQLSQEILKIVDMDIGDEVMIDIREGNLVIIPRKKLHASYDLKKLVQQIPEDYEPKELDWVDPTGKEIW